MCSPARALLPCFESKHESSVPRGETAAKGRCSLPFTSRCGAQRQDQTPSQPLALSPASSWAPRAEGLSIQGSATPCIDPGAALCCALIRGQQELCSPLPGSTEHRRSSERFPQDAARLLCLQQQDAATEPRAGLLCGSLETRRPALVHPGLHVLLVDAAPWQSTALTISAAGEQQHGED